MPYNMHHGNLRSSPIPAACGASQTTGTGHSHLSIDVILFTSFPFTSEIYFTSFKSYSSKITLS